MTSEKPAAPIHLPIIAVIAILWDGVGVFDFIMTQQGNEEYLAEFTPAQIEFFQGLPAWVVGAWAVAVFGGLVGSVLLLMRMRVAAPILAVSFGAMALTTLHNFVLSDGQDAMGSEGVMFACIIFAFSLGLMLYARAMRKRGVLC